MLAVIDRSEQQIPTLGVSNVKKKYGIIFLIGEKKNQTPVRGQDGKISDTHGKDFYWSPNLSLGCLRFFRLALLPVLDLLYLNKLSYLPYLKGLAHLYKLSSSSFLQDHAYFY